MSIRQGCTVPSTAGEPIAGLLRHHICWIHSAHTGSSVTKKSVKWKKLLNKNVASRSRHSLFSWMPRGLHLPKLGVLSTWKFLFTVFYICVYWMAHTKNVCDNHRPKIINIFPLSCKHMFFCLEVSLDVRGGYKLQQSRCLGQFRGHWFTEIGELPGLPQWALSSFNRPVVFGNKHRVN